MVMYSSTGVYMFVYALLTGVLIHKFEYIGYTLYVVGVFLMLTDPFAIKEGGVGNQYIGDLITFLSAGSGAILGIYNSRNSKLVHPIVLMTHTTIISVIFQIGFASFMLGPSKVLSFDPEYGAFGWMTDKDTIIFLLTVVAPFTGILNNL